MTMVSSGLGAVSILISAYASHQEASYTLVSHCVSYQYSRPLSHVLTDGDAAFIVRHTHDHDERRLAQVGFRVLRTFFGDVPDEVTVLSFRPEAEEGRALVEERYALHASAAFFWAYASLPPAYGYLGDDPHDCAMIPLAVPRQAYAVVLQGGRITMFEPVPEGEYPLMEFIEYYAREIRRDNSEYP